MDAQAGLDYVTSHPVLSRAPTVRTLNSTIGLKLHQVTHDVVQILYGQSIGGAVSIDLASRNPLSVRPISLLSSFCSPHH